MEFVCDASPRATWFRIETVGEAALESDLMNHAVEKHFRTARDHAIATYAHRLDGSSSRISVLRRTCVA